MLNRPSRDLVERINKAIQARSPEDRARIAAVIHQAHADAHRLAKDNSEDRAGLQHPELFHAFSALDPSSDGVLAELANLLFGTPDGHGVMYGDKPLEALDPGWLEVAYEWITHPTSSRAPFAQAPARIRIPNEATFALFGDWGAGELSQPCLDIAAYIAGTLAPDYSVHLGDVYYTGIAGNERTRLVERFPGGRAGSFALDSNHEMYPGAQGYFGVALASPLFAAQRGTSYFALENDHFIVVGLDSAYNADYWHLYLQGELKDGTGGAFDSVQLAFLHELAQSGKQLVILTHHNGLSLDGKSFTNLWHEVMSALAGTKSARLPVYWYWGHAHNAAVYKTTTDATTGVVVEPRVIGHAAVPYTVATLLTKSSQVMWSETTYASGHTGRVLNGFLALRLDGAALEETMIDERGNKPWLGRGGTATVPVAQGALASGPITPVGPVQAVVPPELTLTLAQATQVAYAAFDHRSARVPVGWKQVWQWTGWAGFIGPIGAVEIFGVALQSIADPSQVILAFRGTNSDLDGWDDAFFEPTSFTAYDTSKTPSGPPQVSAGFWGVYSGTGGGMTQSMQQQIFGWLAANPGVKAVYITGHSLGGALAELFTLDVALSMPGLATRTIDFAAPMVGFESWANAYEAQPAQRNPATAAIRVANDYDIVPTLPPSIFGYQHVGALFHAAFYKQGEILPNYLVRHELGNYQTVLDNAVWNSPQFWAGTFPDAEDPSITVESDIPAPGISLRGGDMMAPIVAKEREAKRASRRASF
jgi:hypothetical protein